MKLAAIDIGSNAVRLQISAVLEGEQAPVFKKVEYIRFPLRLGQDVFSQGSIGNELAAKFVKLMQTFKQLMDLFEVDGYYACATSALRTSSNGKELVKKVLKTTGLAIEIIDGEQEASLIDQALTAFIPEGPCLHIDVGGGSTELNLYKQRQKIATESFPLGSVRNKQAQDMPQDWKALEQWIQKHTAGRSEKTVALGTGGNISKLYALAGKKGSQPLSYRKLLELKNMIEGHSLHDRIHKLMLNPDRADVIIPASDIYLRIMRWACCSSILVPNIGLKDGLIKHAYELHK